MRNQCIVGGDVVVSADQGPGFWGNHTRASYSGREWGKDFLRVHKSRVPSCGYGVPKAQTNTNPLHSPALQGLELERRKPRAWAASQSPHPKENN